jgi:hypothetical protein
MISLHPEWSIDECSKLRREGAADLRLLDEVGTMMPRLAVAHPAKAGCSNNSGMPM